MKIELDIKELNLIVSVLSAVDPAGIFVYKLKDNLLKQAQSQQVEEVKIQEKKPEGPVIFGGK